MENAAVHGECFRWSGVCQSKAVPKMNLKLCYFSLAQFHIERTIPARSTRAKRPLRLAVRTHPFHGCDTSSILVGVATSQQVVERLTTTLVFNRLRFLNDTTV